MSSDKSEFSVSYGSSSSVGSREETDEDYDVVCNQSDVDSKTIFESKLR